jgi:hypothetical protein
MLAIFFRSSGSSLKFPSKFAFIRDGVFDLEGLSDPFAIPQASATPPSYPTISWNIQGSQEPRDHYRSTTETVVPVTALEQLLGSGFLQKNK